MATTEIDRFADYNYDIIRKSDHKYFDHFLSKKYFWQTTYYNDILIYNKENRRRNSILSNHSTDTIYENELEDKYKINMENSGKDKIDTTNKDVNDDTETISDNSSDSNATDISATARRNSNLSIDSTNSTDSDNQTTCCCDDNNHMSKSASHNDLRQPSLNGIRKYSLTDLRKHSLTDLRKYSLTSNSSSNLTASSRPKSHVDITDTQMYKEIYADNLRQYSFLFAKQLCSSNQSPQELRKSYLKSRQKAIERRERAHTGENAPRRPSVTDRTLEKTPLTRSAHELSTSKYAGSLTDITNIGNSRDSVRKSAINRRKHSKAPQGDPKKRLSLPQFDSAILADIENEVEKQRKCSVPNIKFSNHSTSTSSLAAPDFINGEERKRKLSCESLRRQSVAKERFEYRMNKLKSFDDVLNQAGDLVKDYKRKLSNTCIENRKSTNSNENSKPEINKQFVVNDHTTKKDSIDEKTSNKQSVQEHKSIEKLENNNNIDLNTTNENKTSEQNLNLTKTNEQITNEENMDKTITSTPDEDITNQQSELSSVAGTEETNNTISKSENV